MKLKRLLAAALAGVMAITSSVVTSVTANAAITNENGSEMEPSWGSGTYMVKYANELTAEQWKNCYGIEFNITTDECDGGQFNGVISYTPLDANYDYNWYGSDSETVTVDGTTALVKYHSDTPFDADGANYNTWSYLIFKHYWSQNNNDVTVNSYKYLDANGNDLLAASTPTTYKITCSASESGSVTADKETAAEGETVTLTATPGDGYELDTITVNGKAITGTTFEMPAEDVEVIATFKVVEDEEVLETGTYSDGKWSELSAEELAAAGTLNTIATAKDEYVTTTNTLSVQYNANEQKLRIYKLYNEADLTGKSSGSIVVKKGNVGLKLTAECVYSKLADGQTAPEGCYYIAWVISGVDDPTEFSYSDITLA